MTGPYCTNIAARSLLTLGEWGIAAPVEAAHLTPVLCAAFCFVLCHDLPHLFGSLPVREILGLEICARRVVPGPGASISWPPRQHFVRHELAIRTAGRSLEVSRILAKVGCACVGDFGGA